MHLNFIHVAVYSCSLFILTVVKSSSVYIPQLIYPSSCWWAFRFLLMSSCCVYTQVGSYWVLSSIYILEPNGFPKWWYQFLFFISNICCPTYLQNLALSNSLIFAYLTVALICIFLLLRDWTSLHIFNGHMYFIWNAFSCLMSIFLMICKLFFCCIFGILIVSQLYMLQ